MEDDSSGDRSQQTLAKNRSSNGTRKRKIGASDWPQSGEGEKADEEEEEDCDLEVWKTLNSNFIQVQSVLDQNKVLIQQVNENQRSKIPENLAKNVALIREINANISKVVSLYSDLSVDFSSMIQQRRVGNNKDGEVPRELLNRDE